MTNYFLFIFCDDANEKEELIFGDLEEMIESEIKFFISSGYIILHFATDIPSSELQEFIHIIVSNYSDFFFMMEGTEKCLVGMTKRNLNYFLNLKIIEEFDDDDDDQDDDPDITAQKLMGSLKRNCKIPSLNEILDKINRNGIKSLNKAELKLLNHYSKEKPND